MVSNEDRDMAIRAAAEAVQGPAYGRAATHKAALAVAALIAHGWGPRPTVKRDAIVDRFKDFGGVR